MELSPLAQIVLMVVVLLVVLRLFLATKGRPGKRSRRGAGAGASGAFYEMLSEDKRKAIEIIVEEKAEARDGETADDLTEPPAPRQGKPEL